MKLLIITLVLGAVASYRTAPDVAEKVAQEARENIQIHDGFAAEEKKDIAKEKQVKANKDLSALQRNASQGAKQVDTKPHQAEKEPSAKEVAAMQVHLEQVLTGLRGVANAQKAKGEQNSKFSEILQPFLEEMSHVLTEVKNGTKLSISQKFTLLDNAQKSLAGLAKDMGKRQHELAEESESEKESLLIGVLMAKASRPQAEQLEVMQSDEFKNLTVVKEVLAQPVPGKPLAEQVAAVLDKKAGGKPAKFLNKKQAVDGIIAKLQVQVDKMDKHMKLSEKDHKEHMAKVAEAMKKDEDKARKSNGTKAEVDKKVQRIHTREQRVQKKLEREYQKWHALAAKDSKSLHEAIAAIGKGDLSALAQARKALTESLQRMRGSTGDFLHFLQLSTYTTSRDAACPYCKAQCLEKCHAGGASFVTCMGQCADVGN